jgi:hypothetical protein
MSERYIFERSEYGEPSFTTEVDNIKLDWFMTCMACPEQYDVLIGYKQVGYVRLRGAMLRAAYPDVDADYSFEHHFSDKNDYWKGSFDADSERDYWLDIVGKHLYNKFLESETVR